ncbi:unnamed protein product [Moneuplotes crassus]|uniref:Uncharacterized protein n=1 Tax=Euplotes crassus TaxID=5936 RepID=A0AAD1Y6D0_EUPCR|nr:unnamed protein product [Moneuplotes crassus]
MNQIKSVLIRQRPARGARLFSNYNPQDMNSEYEAVGSDLRQMASSAIKFLDDSLQKEYIEGKEEFDVKGEMMMLFYF